MGKSVSVVDCLSGRGYVPYLCKLLLHRQKEGFVKRLKYRCQRGVSLLIILVVVVVLAIGAVVLKERSRAAAKAERQRVELAQKQEEQRLQREREAAAQREREALQEQERKAAQEQRDLLAQTLKRYDALVQRFYDASRVAGGTGRIALAQPVASMQALHREAMELPTLPCMATGRGDLIDSMQQTVEAYIVFMQNKGDLAQALADIHFKSAAKSIERYRTARAACPSP